MSKVENADHHGHSDHKTVKFKMSVDRRKTETKASTLNKRKGDIRFLRELASKGP